MSVSIPFIAGQWSLLGELISWADSFVKFQSPSLRGSGRFHFHYHYCSGKPRQFQSPSLRGSGRFFQITVHPEPYIWKFQSPSLRGSGRFVIADVLGYHTLHVSIPFIAGQWSLRMSALPAAGGRGCCFNPLHCGAVVASGERPGPRRRAPVFQSPSLRGSGRFSALAALAAWRAEEFQSPSLRGSGRFMNPNM